jgi:hypothetical protein
MKFMVTWHIDQEKWLDVLKVWTSMTPAQQTDAGEGVTILGRWHNTAARTGVAIIESNDAAALYRYIGRWNPHMDLEVSAVLDDAETTAVAAATLADHGA